MADQLLNPIRARFSQIKTTQERADLVREHLARLETAIYSAYAWEANKEEFVDLYTDIYTEEELTVLVDFFGSPTGQKFLSPGSEYVEGIRALNSAKAESLKPQIQAIHDDLRQALGELRNGEDG